MQKHNLFGLDPSILNHVNGIGPVIKQFESRLWRVPKISKKVNVLLHQRLAKPHEYVLPASLCVNLIEETTIFSISQYVKVMSEVNRQLAIDYRKANLKHRHCRLNPDPIVKIMKSFEDYPQPGVFTYNDRQLTRNIDDISYCCRNWIKNTTPQQRRVCIKLGIGTNVFDDVFYFNPYYSSLAKGACIVLDKPTAELYKFLEDFSLDIIAITRLSVQKFKHHIRRPPLPAIIKHRLMTLQLCYPLMCRRYHANIIRQCRYSLKKEGIPCPM